MAVVARGTGVIQRLFGTSLIFRPKGRADKSLAKQEGSESWSNEVGLEQQWQQC
eukprot:NODE_6242_length_520_cov_8.477419.p4 GENE.NODE_6242_length_520_cov_8.477419~~NODE_6242_length_520_cov_8.477419.p4  ORF type:complete len:54 (-),score=2.55 NODE_6242_length_520_cov_8.477419:228-389(-)